MHISAHTWISNIFIKMNRIPAINVNPYSIYIYVYAKMRYVSASEQPIVGITVILLFNQWTHRKDEFRTYAQHSEK